MRFDKNKLSLTMKLTRDLTAVRVIAMELARGSCPRTLSLRAVQKARRGNPIANRSPHYVRDDNPELVIARRVEYTTWQSPYHTVLVTRDGVKRFFREA